MEWTSLVARAIEVISQLDVNYFTDDSEATYRLFENTIRSVKTEVTTDVGRATCLEQHAFMSIESMKQMCAERKENNPARYKQVMNEIHSYLPLKVGICNWCGEEDPGQNVQLVMDVKSVALTKRSVDAMCAAQHFLIVEPAAGSGARSALRKATRRSVIQRPKSEESQGALVEHQQRQEISKQQTSTSQ